MSGVRQFAEGLMQYLRGFVGNGETEVSVAAQFQELRNERDRLQEERVSDRLREWKREGRLHGSPEAESLARALLLSGDASLVNFDGKSAPVSALFAAFVMANGAVAPMGERIPGYMNGVGDASAQLIRMAEDRAKRDGIGYVQAFSLVAKENPSLAQASRS